MNDAPPQPMLTDALPSQMPGIHWPAAVSTRDAPVPALLTEDVVKTSEIEGEVLNVESVRSSIARRLGVDMGAVAAVDRHVEGVVEMVLDATSGNAAPLTAERLFGWHAALFPTGYSGMSQIAIGQWRNDDQLRFVLKEGKKRQTHRMCDTVGLKVPELKRVRIGRVMLGHCRSGSGDICGG